jgi:hypothetical protein
MYHHYHVLTFIKDYKEFTIFAFILRTLWANMICLGTHLLTWSLRPAAAPASPWDPAAATAATPSPRPRHPQPPSATRPPPPDPGPGRACAGLGRRAGTTSARSQTARAPSNTARTRATQQTVQTPFLRTTFSREVSRGNAWSRLAPSRVGAARGSSTTSNRGMGLYMLKPHHHTATLISTRA